MGDTEKELAADLRAIIRATVQNDMSRISYIGRRMKLPDQSVIKMLEAPVWDLALAIKVTDIVQPGVHVVTVQDRTKPVSRARTRPVTMTLDSLAKAAERASGTRTALDIADDIQAAQKEPTETQRALMKMTQDAYTEGAAKLPKSVKDGLK